MTTTGPLNGIHFIHFLAELIVSKFVYTICLVDEGGVKVRRNIDQDSKRVSGMSDTK